MPRRWRHFLLVCATLALLVSACTSPGTPDETSTPTPPTAVITFDPASGTAVAPTVVTFDASHSTGRPSAFQWHVDGRPVSSEATFEFEMSAPGSYAVRLVVRDGRGREASAEAVYVALPPDDDEEEEEPGLPDPPLAVIGFEPPSGLAAAPATVTFDGSGSSGEVAAFEWRLDGSVVGTGQRVDHHFSEPGTYHVELVVTDGEGRQDTAEADYVVVTPARPGQHHELAPDDFAGFQVDLDPVGPWTATTGAPWLAVSPASGEGGPTSVTLSVDAAQLPTSGGSFETALTFTEAQGGRADTVTVLLPELAPLPPIQQGDLIAGTERYIPLEPSNLGSHELTVRFRVQGSGDIAVLPELDGTLHVSPGSSFSTGLVVTCPAHAAEFVGTLTAETNDPRTPSASLPLSFACVESPPTSGYSVTLVFQPGAFTPEQQAMVRAAADRWEEVMVSEIPSAALLHPSTQERCLEWMSWEDHAVPQEIRQHVPFDGLLVAVTAYAVEGSVLAQAGPCTALGHLPNFGRIWVNTNRLDYMTSTNSLETVMVHELGHVIGIGTIWLDEHRALMRPGRYQCDPVSQPEVARTFAGQAGVAEFHSLGGSNEPPLDLLCHHWNEDRFQTEALTPFITIRADGANHQPLSRMTLGALQDLGYDVDYDAADAYSLPAPGFRVDPHEAGAETFAHSDPIVVILDRH